MNVSLTPEMEQFVKHLVESGMYPTENEVIRQGIRLMQEQYEVYKFRLADLRKEIAIGVEQAERGEVAPLDMEALKAKWRKHLSQAQENGDGSASPHQPSRTGSG